MALHERFKEYTAKEILEIKRKVCLANKCPYLGYVSHYTNKGSKDYSIAHKCCNYISITGKMRDCMPDECTHYKDTDIKQFNFSNDYFVNERRYEDE